MTHCFNGGNVNGILLKRGFTDLAGQDYWHLVQIPSFHLNACRGGKSYYWEWIVS